MSATTSTASAPAAERRAAARRLAQGAIPAAFALIAGLAMLPLPPVFAAADLDASWAQALHVAVQQGLAFGSDIVFTYGPLGFPVTRLYWPGLFGVTLAFWAALALGTLDAWNGLAARAGSWGLAAWPLLAACCVFASDFAFDFFVFAYLLAWVLDVEAREARAPRLAAHGALVGALALSKLTFTVAGAAALALAAVALLQRGERGRAAIPAVAALGAFLAGWLALSQPLAALPGYFAGSLEIMAGYEEAMGRPGDRWETWAYGLVALASWGIIAAFAVRRRDPRLLVACIFGLVIHAIVWKAHFTRPDLRGVAAFTFTFVAALALSTRLPPGVRLWACASRGVAIAAAVLVVVATEMRQPGAIGRVPLDMVRRPLQVLEGLVDVARGMPAMHARHEAALARIRGVDPLPRLAGTVDVYSHGQAAVFAHGLRWHPRPVFQSYSAYTAAMAELNRRHLEREGAEHLLVRIQPIDGRLPALEDGASWLSMLERYALAAEEGFVRLDRQPAPVPAVAGTVPPWKGSGWRELPADAALLLAAIAIEEPARALRNPFKRAAMFEIQLRLEDGAVHGFRFLRSAGQAPFVLSPLVTSTPAFASLFVPCSHAAAPPRVRAVRIMGPGDREVAYSLALRTVASVPGFEASAASPLRMLECRLRLVSGNEAVRTKPHVHDGEFRGINAHPPATFRIARAAAKVRACARMARLPAGAGPSDGYVMKLQRSGAGRPIAETRVAAAAEPGEACVEGRLDRPASDLELRIEPGGHSHWDWVYLTRVDLDD